MTTGTCQEGGNGAIQSVATDGERRNPEVSPNLAFVYVDIGSVDNDKGSIRLDNTKKLLGRNAPSRARKAIRANDIIFATTRPYLRNIALVPLELDGEICSTGFCVIRSIGELAEPKFLYYACRSSFLLEQLIPKQRGANYPAISDSDVYEALLPLPYPDDPPRSTAEQRRIVARIEALFAELGECRRLHGEIVADTGRLMDAVLREKFGDISGDISQLGDECDILGGGTLPEAEEDVPFEEAILLLKVAELNRPENTPAITTAQRVISRSTASIRGYRIISPDSIILPKRGGAIATNKKRLLTRPAILDPNLMGITPKSQRLLSEFLLSWFETFDLKTISSGSTVPQLNRRDLLPILLPIPSEYTQQQVVASANQIRQEIDDMQVINIQNSTFLTGMEQAILSRAFRGEI